jgi:hypothetical protein
MFPLFQGLYTHPEVNFFDYFSTRWENAIERTEAVVLAFTLIYNILK